MNVQSPDPRLDRLYELLPGAYRSDELQALLRVIAEQVNVIEDDIAQMYENLFIETCQDWVVPYIGDLVGYRVPTPTEPLEPKREVARTRMLVPRRDVANTVRSRRRKGTLAVLEELARDVADWPARAVEGVNLVVTTAAVNHPPHLGTTVDVRQVRLEPLNRPFEQTSNTLDVRQVRLEPLNSPFDQTAHTLDVRDAGNPLSSGAHPSSVTVFVWRLRAYPITETSILCQEKVAPHCYTFSAFDQDLPLYAKPVPEPDPDHIAEAVNLPLPISRQALEAAPEKFIGPDLSLRIWVRFTERTERRPNAQPRTKRLELAAHNIAVADLSDWLAHSPPHTLSELDNQPTVKLEGQPDRKVVLLDPERGRLVFHPDDHIRDVQVSYHHGVVADLGGGEYERSLEPLPEPIPKDLFFYCRVGQNEKYKHVASALKGWQKERAKRKRALIEITDSDLYREHISVTLGAEEHLTIRAANKTRPVIQLIDQHPSRPDGFNISSSFEDQPGGCVVLDGLTITGGAVHVEGPICKVTIRDSTLVPGWGLDDDCEPQKPGAPSLELYNTAARVEIERSIIGPIRVRQDEGKADPVCLQISDSIIDATNDIRAAIQGVGSKHAHVSLQIKTSTVIGETKIHAITLAENSIFSGKMHVARRQIGCIRFSYVPLESRTPRRYHCQPDLITQLVTSTDPEAQKTIWLEQARTMPRFESHRYGQASYARLTQQTANEIARGADDESEMGVYHRLYEPQRTDNLKIRLEEFTPAGFEVGLIKQN
jgi:hypothetical protein